MSKETKYIYLGKNIDLPEFGFVKGNVYYGEKIEELKKKYTEESINKYKAKVIEIKNLVDEIKEGINELSKEKNKEKESEK